MGRHAVWGPPQQVESADPQRPTIRLWRLVESLPNLRAVAFNGGLAAKLGRRVLRELEGVALVDLPSSSPAHAISLSAKADSWAILGKFLPG